MTLDDSHGGSTAFPDRAFDRGTNRVRLGWRRRLTSVVLMLLSEALVDLGARAAEPGTTSWHVEGFARWRSLSVPEPGRTGFQRLSLDVTGVAFTNELSAAQGATNRVLWNGSGVAVGDFNGDGLPDLYLCRLEGTNALYANLGGFRFREVTRDAGLGRPSRFDRGAVFADVNGDGALDLLVATTGEGVRCHLNDGKARFLDVSRSVGTRSQSGSTTLALADVNGDGFLDLYVANYRTEDIKDRGRVTLPTRNGQSFVPPEWADVLVIREGQLLQYGEPDVLYLNNGRSGFRAVEWTDGTFVDEAGQPLTALPRDWGLSATFRDINGDAFPDLYVCNDFWTPDRIWLGDGAGQFRALEAHALRKMSGSSMGVDFADLDRDGHLDFLVVEMLARDPALRKRQMMPTEPDGTGIGETANRPQVLRNTLFRNRGDGSFAELANYAGLAASDWSWSPLFMDVDLDGFEDVLIAAGHIHDLLDADARESIRAGGARRGREENDALFPLLAQPVVAFRNRGDWRFQDVTDSWGTDSRSVHHALATADFDWDGDLDLVATTLNSPVEIYRNESGAPRVAVRLRGRSPNGQGIGARVVFRGGAVPMQLQEVVSGGRYLAGSDPQLVFAAGQARTGMSIEVLWRSGRRSVVVGVGANRLYEIAESAEPVSKSESSLEKARPSSLFEDRSAALAHRHLDASFDDFARQPLLHRRLSQGGPGVAWFDVDLDGREDLIVGAGAGGRRVVYRNEGQGRFLELPLNLNGGARSVVPPAPVPAPTERRPPSPGSGSQRPIRESGSPSMAGAAGVVDRDQTGLVGWRPTRQQAWVMAGISRWEGVPAMGAAVEVWDPSSSTVRCAIPLGDASTTALALADLDGDGGCELFVGSGAVPGQYPMAGPSGFFRWDGVEWRRDGSIDGLLTGVGIVQGAVWTDLEGDGFPELLLACEWGPIRVFRNRGGRLTAWDPRLEIPGSVEPVPLSAFTGWWNSVTTGDFDGDGRLDIVAGNWGANSEFRASPAHPFRLYYGNFSGGPGLDLIETEWDPVRKVLTPRRRRDELAVGLPWLPAHFATHRAYSEASLAEVLQGQGDAVPYVQAMTFASFVLLNRGERFVPATLPPVAQLSPAFGLVVADADGDGREDLFIAQNFFGTRPEISRMDAGRGLWLLGDGAGHFRGLSPRESGIEVDGQGRGAAVSDYDEDGRPDLVVGQHGGPTRLFRNVGALPGVRVRLEGPDGNPAGIGAALRLGGPRGSGPAREVHGGAGYASQDGAVTVLGRIPSAEWIEVRWPGGRTNRVSIVSSATEVVIRFGDAH